MRDNRVPEANFNQLLTECKNSIALLDKAVSNGQLPAPRLKIIKQTLITNSIVLAEAHYSIDANKGEMQALFENALRYFEQGYKWEPGKALYERMIWMVSLAILCDSPVEMFERISKIIERDKVSDKLLDFLIKYKQPDWEGNSSNFIQNEPYKAISKAIDEPDGQNGIKLLQNYLSPKVWYAGHSDAGWYDSHKNKRVNTYSGYWAWEAAALVKAKGWNDEALKGTDYYPYDAVHW